MKFSGAIPLDPRIVHSTYSGVHVDRRKWVSEIRSQLETVTNHKFWTDYVLDAKGQAKEARVEQWRESETAFQALIPVMSEYVVRHYTEAQEVETLTRINREYLAIVRYLFTTGLVKVEIPDDDGSYGDALDSIGQSLESPE